MLARKPAAAVDQQRQEPGEDAWFAPGAVRESMKPAKGASRTSFTSSMASRTSPWSVLARTSARRWARDRGADVGLTLGLAAAAVEPWSVSCDQLDRGESRAPTATKWPTATAAIRTRNPSHVYYRQPPCRPLPPRERLVAELREHALVIGEVTLTSGPTAQYYVDAKRAILRPAGFARSASWCARRRSAPAPPRSAG